MIKDCYETYISPWYAGSDDLGSELDDIRDNIEPLRGEIIDIFQTPVDTIQQYDLSDIYGIGASALYVWMHIQQVYSEIQQYSATTHNGESYPDFEVDGTELGINSRPCLIRIVRLEGLGQTTKPQQGLSNKLIQSKRKRFVVDFLMGPY